MPRLSLFRPAVPLLALALAGVLLAGCGGEYMAKRADEATTSVAARASMPSETPAEGIEAAGGDAAPASAESPVPRPSAVERKIIYTAEVTLVAEDFSKAETALAGTVRQHGGFIATA